MTYKEQFLNWLLLYILDLYNQDSYYVKRCAKNSQDLYDRLIPFGRSHSEYIILPMIHKYDVKEGFWSATEKPEFVEHDFQVFNIEDINKKNFLKKNENNIWFVFYNNFDYAVGEYRTRIYNFYRELECYKKHLIVNIDRDKFIDETDSKNVNAKPYTIREACKKQRNNEFKELIKNYLIIITSPSLSTEPFLLLSKKFIYDGLRDHINNILSKEVVTFEDELLHEFLKIFNFNDKIRY